jgi:hypothetical protein
MLKPEANTTVNENRVVAAVSVGVCKCGRTWPVVCMYEDLGVGICCLAKALDALYAGIREDEEQASNE